MRNLRHIIVGLAFGAVLALPLAMNASTALAASVAVDSHAVAVERGPNCCTTLTPFDALGITWE